MEMRGSSTLVVSAVSLALTASACARERHFQLSGQVLAIDQARQEITIAHGDIAGFMPGMTMPFKVKDAKLLDGKTTGDLVTATLAVRDTTAVLTAIERTGHADVASAPPPAVPLTLVSPGETVGDAIFTDESGARHSLADWRGRTLAVTFIYTRCPLPDFCPRMNRNFGAVQHGVIADPGLRTKVRLLSITLDPAFDTPAVLADFARRAAANPEVWSFLTGDAASVQRFASQFGISTMPGEAAGEVVHNLRTAVIASDGRLIAVLSGTEWTPDELLGILRGRA
jgi:protein SCO1/2